MTSTKGALREPPLPGRPVPEMGGKGGRDPGGEGRGGPHTGRAQSGASHDGFSCPRQCRCAASSLDSTEPHSGHSTPALSGLAAQDVAMCRWASCTREKVLAQYSHCVRFVRAGAVRRRGRRCADPEPEEEEEVRLAGRRVVVVVVVVVLVLVVGTGAGDVLSELSPSTDAFSMAVSEGA